ncbi:DUF6632 domain-containing protein [Paraburkholderia sp. J11-2]|uniref:DUF6632 domain-containing protein n=1 Tax=Paraburkholderia sp. J11-2 TaxID=2805431 RepID=UPI0039EFFCD2
MDHSMRLKSLSAALYAVGAIATFGFYPLMVLWPSGWAWHSGHSDYSLMIVGIYATLGVFLMRAARRPLEHLSLIWFTVWSSVVHGAIMTLQSFMSPGHLGHLIGDVPALFIVAAVLAALTPRRAQAGAGAPPQSSLRTN